MATVYRQDAINGVLYVENSFQSGSGSGDVVGPGSSTDRAIASWNGTSGTVLQDNPNAIVQAGGAVQAEAIVVQKSITTLVTIPSDYTMIASNIEIDGGEIDIEADGELVIV